MNINVKGLVLLWSLIILLPSIIFINLSQSSYASGMVCSCLSIVGLYYSIKHGRKNDIYFSISELRAFWGIIFSFIVFHMCLAICLNVSFEPFRAIGSFFILGLMVVAACLVVLILQGSSLENFNLSLMKLLWIFAFIALVSGVFNFAPTATYKALNRQVFPFLEPSHFALAIAPYFLWILNIQTKGIFKILVVLGALFLLVFINNLTLLCLILLASGLSIRYYYFIGILLIVGAVLYFGNVDLTYYTRRVDLNDSNMSTLVWIQGWEEAWINFENTFGLGVGFQQFGVVDLQGDAADLLYKLNNGEYLNRYDGGTFASKVIGEFGILGIGFIMLICIRIARSIFFLKSYNPESKQTKLLFFHCCIAYFCIEVFVRSTSYIAPGFFIFMVGLIGLKVDSSNRLIERKLILD